ncbi:hypothetical protein ACHAXS_005709 [Conticribra weissflogii]
MVVSSNDKVDKQYWHGFHQNGEAVYEGDGTVPSSVKQINAFRPRLIFCPLFAWNAITGGKFIAPLLEQMSPNYKESVIGITLSLQYALVACLAGWGGSLADTEEKQSRVWGLGRLKVMSWGILLGTFAFLGHDLPQYIQWDDLLSNDDDNQYDKDISDDFQWKFEFSWHVSMRCLWAVSFALTAPAMDGLSLAHLECIDGATRMDFGQERMYGAVFWGVGSLVAGMGIDHFGFDFLYVMAIFWALATYFTVVLYIWGLNRDTTGSFQLNKDGSNLEWMHQKNMGRSISQKEDPMSTGRLFLILFGTCYGSALVLFIFTFAIGMAVVDNLAFIFFDFLGSTNTENGWTVVLTVIFELPLFYLAPQLLQKYGPGKLLLFAGLAYAIRVFGYTLVPTGHMWIILLLETLHGISYACSKAGSVEFVAQKMPKGCEASCQGILFSVRFVGVVIGLSGGGIVQEKFGPRVMYTTMAFTVLAGMFALLLAETCARDRVLDTIATGLEGTEPGESDNLIRSESAFADQSTEKWVRSLKYDSLGRKTKYGRNNYDNPKYIRGKQLH